MLSTFTRYSLLINFWIVLPTHDLNFSDKSDCFFPCFNFQICSQLRDTRSSGPKNRTDKKHGLQGKNEKRNTLKLRKSAHIFL